MGCSCRIDHGLRLQNIPACQKHLPITIGLLQGVAELDEYGYVAAGEQGITSAQGLFVAGDVRTKALRQVITAAADGANAATEAERYIRR